MSPVERPASQQRKPMPTSLSGARAGSGTIFAEGLARLDAVFELELAMVDLIAIQGDKLDAGDGR
jgi:hypothetical protein